MNSIPKSFLSPLLAQARLRFSGNNSGGSTQQCSDTDLPLSDAIEEKPSYRKHGCLEFLETRGLASSL